MGESPCQKAVSLRTSRVVYYRQRGNAKSEYEVFDGETGELMQMTPRQFEAMYVPDWRLPPHMRARATKAPSWWDWKARRKA